MEFLVDHEMKEACVHIIICTATFSESIGSFLPHSNRPLAVGDGPLTVPMPRSRLFLSLGGEEKKVRQYFKFQVLKPISVNTKIHMMLGSIYLENQIQNIAQAPLYLDTVSFEPAAAYALQDLNGVTPHAAHTRDTRPQF